MIGDAAHPTAPGTQHAVTTNSCPRGRRQTGGSRRTGGHVQVKNFNDIVFFLFFILFIIRPVVILVVESDSFISSWKQPINITQSSTAGSERTKTVSVRYVYV